MTELQGSWERSWRALGASGDGQTVMQQLITAYQSPHRHYHTLHHLSECLTLFAAVSSLATHSGEVEIALWFHDAVYDVRAQDNEAQSAAWAEVALTGVGVEPDAIARIRQLILATCHLSCPTEPDQQLLVDIDLAILAAPCSRFMEYETQIRREYDWVPDSIFRDKRQVILQAFLDRDRLYQTPILHESLELSARKNLLAAIAQLHH